MAPKLVDVNVAVITRVALFTVVGLPELAPAVHAIVTPGSQNGANASVIVILAAPVESRGMVTCLVWPSVRVCDVTVGVAPVVFQTGVPEGEVEVKEKVCVWPIGKVAFVRLIYPLMMISVTRACVPVGLVLHFDVVPGASPAEQVAKFPLLVAS